MKNLVPARRPVLDFTPVPRKYRHDGWTPERQRGFIAALAETGSVTAAAARINMAKEGAYQMRLAPGGESFRAAWAQALDHGVQGLVDIAIDRAREGVAVPIFHKGEQVGEKRWFNDRLLMFLLKHHLPGKYGTPGLPRGTVHPETAEREAAENCPVCRERRETEAAEQAALDDPDQGLPEDYKKWLEKVLRAYGAKVRGERQLRLSGRIVAADYTLRQLTYIELILVAGGLGQQLIDLWSFRTGDDGRQQEVYACALSATLDDVRRKAWEEAGEPARPPLDLREIVPESDQRSGPTYAERERARIAAERRIAEAQREWEAAATEEGWAAWNGARPQNSNGSGLRPRASAPTEAAR